MAAKLLIDAPGGTPLSLAGEMLTLDPSGALIWPAAATVVVADLHLEKGSGYAGNGALVPPYDTAATLAQLDAVLRRSGARRVICLGDSFHDGEAAARLAEADRAQLAALVAAYDWLWVAGNHDPHPPAGLGGAVVGEIAIGELCFRHEAAATLPAAGEVSGHFHPKSAIRARGRRLAGRCFVGDRRRLILPAFGAYAGGLDVGDPAFAHLFPDGFDVHLVARGRVVRLPRSDGASRGPRPSRPPEDNSGRNARSPAIRR